MRIIQAALFLSLAACAGEISDIDDGDGDGSGSNEPEPVVCETTRSYPGFGGASLEADRLAIEPGSDRLRLKPFTVLATEYNRALGLTGFNTGPYAATFGRPPARWFAEPLASASTLYAAYALAYDACTQHTTANAAAFANAPTTVIADRICRDFARAAWHREATDAEAATCATFAVDKTNSADAPAKRWAYTCAAVLTAEGFLAY